MRKWCWKSTYFSVLSDALIGFHVEDGVVVKSKMSAVQLYM